MTIVAGFLLQEHIVLCGDTMVTSGIKTHQSKLQGFHVNDGAERYTFGFALAGNEVNGEMAIQDCIAALSECPKQELTLRKATEILREAIADINRRYVDGRSDTERFDLIIGAWLPRGGGLKLFSTAGGSGVIRRDHECLGSGYWLANIIANPMFHRRMRLDETVLLAIQAIAAAKKYDPYCGGDTNFMVIARGGAISAAVPYRAVEVENYIADFDNSSRRLLLDLGNAELQEADIERKLAEFVEVGRRVRAFLRNRGFDYMTSFLQRLMQAAKPHPESTTADQSPPPPSQE